MTRFLIYGLVDPRDGQLKYIGRSCSGMTRPMQHRQPSILKKERSYKANWIRSLAVEGLDYEIRVIESFEDRKPLREAEAYWVAYFRSIGCDLTNSTPSEEPAPHDNVSASLLQPRKTGRKSSTEKVRDAVIDMLRKGMTIEEIARSVDKHPSSVWRMLNRYKLTRKDFDDIQHENRIKYPTPCQSCHHHRRTEPDGICWRCHRVSELRECRKCHELLAIHLSFYTESSKKCKTCIGEERRSSHKFARVERQR